MRVGEGSTPATPPGATFPPPGMAADDPRDVAHALPFGVPARLHTPACRALHGALLAHVASGATDAARVTDAAAACARVARRAGIASTEVLAALDAMEGALPSPSGLRSSLGWVVLHEYYIA